MIDIKLKFNFVIGFLETASLLTVEIPTLNVIDFLLFRGGSKKIYFYQTTYFISFSFDCPTPQKKKHGNICWSFPWGLPCPSNQASRRWHRSSHEKWWGVLTRQGSFHLGSILVTQWNCWTAMKTTSIRDLTIWPKHGDVNQFENTTWARLGPILETTLRRQQGALWTAMLHSIRTRAKTPCRRLWKPAFLLGWRNWRRMKHSSAPKRSWCSVWFTENIFWCFCDVRNFFLQSKFTSHCNLYLTDFSCYHLAVSTISYHKVFQK